MTRQRALWVALLGALIVLPNLFAFEQFRATNGYLFYANAFDEPTYLSYDGAMMTRSPTHAAEYLIVGLHNLGVSGGYINLLFDLIFPVLIVTFLRRIALLVGFSALESIVYPFLVVALPVLFGYSNPYYATLFNRNYASWTLSWITLPQAYYPPFFRTPEPQSSLLLLAIATYAALKRQSYFIALGAAAIVYPLVGVPYAFVTLCLLVADKGRRVVDSQTWRVAIAAVSAYTLIAAAVFSYHALFVRGSMLADFLPATRLPLLSGTGAAGLILFALTRTRLPPHLRNPALFLALAPMAVANTQLVSGFISQPHGFEQNFGVVAVGLLVAIAIHTLSHRRWVVVGAGGLAAILFGVYSTHVFAVNGSIWQQMRPSPKLLEALRRSPDNVLMADPDLADTYALIAPRLHFSALARAQTYPAGSVLTSARFERYLCTKQLVSRSAAARSIPAETFQVMDRSFQYLNQDFPLGHLNRTSGLKPVFDPLKTPTQCVARQLQLFPALEIGATVADESLFESLRQVLKASPTGERGVGFITAPAQWGYAALVPLPPMPAVNGTPVRMADVRLKATVERGCIGAGVLSPDQQAFDTRTLIRASPGTQVVDIVFQPRAPHGWFVVMNCSAEGASAATIDSIQLLTVDDVSVRALDERGVELEP